MSKKIIFTFIGSILIGLFLVNSVAAANNKAKFILSSTRQALKPGDILKTTVTIDTGVGNGINSYQLVLNYPQAKLTFVSFDAANSPFNMVLQSGGTNGVVNIIRGTTTTQTGKLLVGTLVFKATKNTSANELNISTDSAIVRSSDNTNILDGSTIQNQPITTPTIKPKPTPLPTPSTAQLSFWNWLKKHWPRFFR